MTTEQGKQQLFACACERWIPRLKDWKAEIIYVHADDLSLAEHGFRRAHMGEIMRRTLRIVGIAPVIGYKVLDKKGLVLSA